jgi:FKBP-type peptidyl-prolyl cis-trans isomerase FkpA
MKDSSFTGYTPLATHYVANTNPSDTVSKVINVPATIYYKVLTAGTGTDPININSSITYYDTGQMLNGTIIDNNNNVAGGLPASADVVTLVNGLQQALIGHATVGTKISIFLPSGMAYGTATSGSVVPNSCLRFTFTIVTVTP